MCLWILPEPDIPGLCEFVSSTDQSLTFTWSQTQSATSYHLVGHSRSMSTVTNGITVNGLTAGSDYTFTMWAVNSQGLFTDNFTCSGRTGRPVSCRCWIIISRVSQSSSWPQNSRRGVLGWNRKWRENKKKLLLILISQNTLKRFLAWYRSHCPGSRAMFTSQVSKMTHVLTASQQVLCPHYTCLRSVKNHEPKSCGGCPLSESLKSHIPIPATDSRTATPSAVLCVYHLWTR